MELPNGNPVKNTNCRGQSGVRPYFMSGSLSKCWQKII